MTAVRVLENVWTGKALERSTGWVWECLGEVEAGGQVTVRRAGTTRTASPDDLTPFPAMGQMVSLGARSGYWLGVEEVDAASREVGYWLLDENRTVRVERCSWDALAGAPAPWIEATREQLATEDVLSALTRALVGSQEQFDAITRRLHAEADDRGYCSEFDEIMEEIGLPSRRSEHTLTVEVEAFTVTVEVSARSREEAGDAISQSMVDAAIIQLVNSINLDYEVID